MPFRSIIYSVMLLAAALFPWATPASAQGSAYSVSWVTYDASTKAVRGYSEVEDLDDPGDFVTVDGSLFNDADYDVADENYNSGYGEADVTNSDTAWAASTYWEWGDYTSADAGDWSDAPGGYYSISPSGIPGSLLAISASALGCGSAYGYQIDITYQLLDSNGLWWIDSGAGGLLVAESLGTVSITDLSHNLLATAPGFGLSFLTYTDEYGGFDDTPYGVCYDSIPGLGAIPTIWTGAPQDIYVAGELVRYNAPTFTALSGGGSVTNGVDMTCSSGSSCPP